MSKAHVDREELEYLFKLLYERGRLSEREYREALEKAALRKGKGESR